MQFERPTDGGAWTSIELTSFNIMAYSVGAALERRDLARSRRDCEHRYQALFEETNDAIFVLDLEGNHLATNHRAAEMLGYDIEELRRASFRQIVALDEQDQALAVRSTLLAGGKVPLYERRFIKKNGEEIPVEINATLVSDEVGNPLYIQSAARDISKRRQAEAALVERRRVLHLLISSMPNLLLLVDSSNSLAAFYAPPHFRSLLEGYGIVPGRPLAAIMPPDEADHVVRILEEVRSSGALRELDHRVSIGGAIAYLHIKVSPVTDSSDILIVVDDVTGQRQTEQALRRRDAILETLAYTSEKLLLGDPGVLIPELLERLGKTVSASHVYLLENQTSKGEDGRSILRYAWAADDSAATGGASGPDTHLGRWAEVLSSGQPICITAQELPPAEKQFLDGQGIRSIALVPVFSDGVWWGVLGFGESSRESAWLIPEIEAFKSIAAALGAAFARAGIQKAEQEQRALAEALRDIGATLNRTLDLDQILDQILAHLDRVVPHDSANIMLIDQGTARLVRARGYAERGAEEALGAVYFPANSLFDLRQMIEAGQPVAIPDTRAQPEWTDAPETQWIRSYAGAPIRLDGELIGLLNVDSAIPGFLTQTHAERLQAFADQAAIAIRNARLYHSVEGLAAFQERQRLARELHDGVSQSLSSANLIADVLPRVWEQSPERGRAALGQLHLLTQSALAEMRMLLMELRPEAILDMKMIDLLSRLAQVASSRAGIAVNTDVTGEAEPPPAVKYGLYRIAQEALNNVAKHARAAEASIALAINPDSAELHIRDNGAGFEPAQTSADHFGLCIMRERADEIGADLHISSQPGQGTHISVLWMAQGATTTYEH